MKQDRHLIGDLDRLVLHSMKTREGEVNLLRERVFRRQEINGQEVITMIMGREWNIKEEDEMSLIAEVVVEEDGITTRDYHREDKIRRYRVYLSRRHHSRRRDVRDVDTVTHLINSLQRWAEFATIVVRLIISGVVANKQGEEHHNNIRDVQLF